MRMRIAMAGLMCAALMNAESVANLQWKAPAGWSSKGEAPMRAATYPVAAAAGDKEGGECVVYFFGQGQGGTVEMNMARWQSQFTAPGGKPAMAKIAKKMVHGIPVTTIDVTGSYSGMGGPMAKAEPTKVTYRMLGAIFEDAGGNVFLKFTAPEKTVTANQAKFEALVNSFSRSGK